jgi:hypothetical protein
MRSCDSMAYSSSRARSNPATPLLGLFVRSLSTRRRQTQDWTTRSVLTASGRRRKVSYVASGCEDIDL